MKKSVIKSIYHWFIMSLVMGMPLVLTAVSYIPNAYNDNNIIDYNVVERVTADKYVPEEYYSTTYYLDMTGLYNYSMDNPSEMVTINFSSISSLDITYDYSDSDTRTFTKDTYILTYTRSRGYYQLECRTIENPIIYFDVTGGTLSGLLSNALTYNNLLVYGKYLSFDNLVSTQVVNNGAYQVWQYNQKLLNMPINQWYSSLLNLTIGVPNEYSPINNIVVFPLYAIWVVIFDLLFDCIVMIPKLCHSWLRKLDKDNE